MLSHTKSFCWADDLFCFLVYPLPICHLRTLIYFRACSLLHSFTVRQQMKRGSQTVGLDVESHLLTDLLYLPTHANITDVTAAAARCTPDTNPTWLSEVLCMLHWFAVTYWGYIKYLDSRYSVYRRTHIGVCYHWWVRDRLLACHVWGSCFIYLLVQEPFQPPSCQRRIMELLLERLWLSHDVSVASQPWASLTRLQSAHMNPQKEGQFIWSS